MNTTALISEFLMSGTILTSAIFFLLLLILDVRDLTIFLELKNISTAIILLIFSVAYFLGALIQRLISPRMVFNSLCRIKLLQKLLLKPGGKWTPKHGIAFYTILQYGSEHLITRVQYKQSMTRLLTSAIITLPLLKVSLTAWLWRSYGWQSSLFSFTSFTLVWMLTIIASFQAHVSFNRVVLYSRQSIQHKELESESTAI